MIRGVKGPDHLIEVCMAGSCQRNGAEEILKAIKNKLGIPENETTTPDGKIKVTESGCLWLCKQPPVISVDGKLYTNVDEDKAESIIDELMKC